MLEFIVLGQIPGTHLQVSFGIVVALLLIGVGTFLLATWSKHRDSLHTESKFALIYMSLFLRR